MIRPADVVLFPDGQFVMPSDEILGALEATDRARISAIAEAWDHQQSAEADLQEASDRLTTIVTQLREVETYLHERFAKPTHLDQLRQMGMNKEIKA